jgi:hypothetical protein
VPADRAAVVNVNATLAWTSSGATDYDIAFGTTNPPAMVATARANASYPVATTASTTYFWRITARNATGTTIGPVWSFTTAAAAPAPLPPGDIVLYASDVGSSGLHGTWRAIADGSSPNGIKLGSADNGAPSSDPLGTPANYVDVAFDAVAATPYTLWMRVQAAGDSKYNDSLWVQFSGALVDGAPAYGIGSASALLVNLASDATGAGLAGWGWVNSGYWLDQRATVTFATSGPHTMRVQTREDGVAFDQIVLSRGPYASPSASCPPACAGAPGPLANDRTIVPKP